MKTYNQLLNENKAWAEEVFAKIDKKLAKVTVRNTEKIADGCDEAGMFKDCRGIAWWTNGFWGGLNHLLYNQTGNEDYLKTALANADYYFVSPAFNGSSKARDEVAKLMQTCLTTQAADIDAMILQAFKDAVKECEADA